MRSWPLDSFRNQPPKSQERGSNPWNGAMGKICVDCKNEATLWVEATFNTKSNQLRTAYGGLPEKTYAKMCETCYALRILGANA